jgi:Arc/MetJ family transcription regulator
LSKTDGGFCAGRFTVLTVMGQSSADLHATGTYWYRDQAWISSPNGAICNALIRKPTMRSTINLDDTLIERARSLTGTKETATLVRQALETLVRVESGKRLIALGGTMPDAEAAPRRRSAAAK